MINWKIVRYGWIFGALVSLADKLIMNGILTIEEVKDILLFFLVGYVWISYFKLRQERIRHEMLV